MSDMYSSNSSPALATASPFRQRLQQFQQFQQFQPCDEIQPALPVSGPLPRVSAQGLGPPLGGRRGQTSTPLPVARISECLVDEQQQHSVYVLPAPECTVCTECTEYLDRAAAPRRSSTVMLPQQAAVRIEDNEDDTAKVAEEIELLSEWRNMAHRYGWLHTSSSRFFNDRNLLYVVPIVTLSSVAGAVSLVVGVCDEPVMRYIVGFMGLAAAALTTVHNLLNYGERAGMHKHSADGFDQLARAIAVESVIHNTNGKTYANLTEFLKECNVRFNRLVERAPEIPECIMHKIARTGAAHQSRGGSAESPRKPGLFSGMSMSMGLRLGTIPRSLALLPRSPPLRRASLRHALDDQLSQTTMATILRKQQQRRNSDASGGDRERTSSLQS
jgi:hypothetical protein